MSAPKGNRFWEKRAKHGREKIFKKPEYLWEAACEYFKWCEDNPLMAAEAKVVSMGKVGSEIVNAEVPKMRAFTWEGLEIFLDISSLRDYKTNPAYQDFLQVITRIERIIYNQKFTGAAAGFLDSRIIARDLGLRENVSQEVITNQPPKKIRLTDGTEIEI